MNPRNEALARQLLRTIDAQGDVFALLSDDIEYVYPKWGVARGKIELGRLFQDLATYLRSITHHQDTFKCLSDDESVFIEGQSSGRLVDGRSWRPDGGTAGRFCTSFRIRDGLISGVYVYIDPDYTDQTANFYPWRK